NIEIYEFILPVCEIQEVINFLEPCRRRCCDYLLAGTHFGEFYELVDSDIRHFLNLPCGPSNNDGVDLLHGAQSEMEYRINRRLKSPDRQSFFDEGLFSGIDRDPGPDGECVFVPFQ